MKRQSSTILFILALANLAGSSSGSSSGDSNRLQTGTFGSVPVAGLNYVTETQSGLTSNTGEFSFFPGETVEFFLSEQSLGTALATTNVTEFDIARLDRIPQNHLEWSAYYQLRSGRSALSKAANIGGILQSLDTDSNLDNNIQIDADVSALIDENMLDLNQPPWHLRSDRRMRKLLYRANLYAGLTPRPVRTGALALQPMFPFDTIDQYQRFERDDNNDGSIDAVQTIEYGPLGKLAVIRYDNDADGVIESRHENVYNTNNVHVESRTDTADDGSIDYG